MTIALRDAVEGEVSPFQPELTDDPAVLSRHIKRLGYFHRADIAGICELPQWAVYSHDGKGNQIELNHKFAVLFLVDMGFETMKASIGFDWISRSQNFHSYVHSALVSCMVASYIRKLGYSARAHHVTNELIVIPPLLLLAGIGEVARPGIVLNPYIGLRYKASVVTTDMPLVSDKPIDFGLQEFCRKCGKCADLCPSKAITHGDKIVYNGYETWKLDEERCLRFMKVLNSKGDSCLRCVKVCPWNKPRGWTHDTARWVAGHTPWLDRFLIKMDDVMGYGKPDRRGKWWFDLVKTDDGFQTVERAQQKGR
jgi:reductive dehalogenase